MDKEIKNTDEDSLPPKAIEVFVQQLAGNKKMPLEQGVQYPRLAHKLKPVETLPLPVQNVISEIRAAGSIEEKATIAHAFSQAYITDTLQFGGKLGEERDVSFEEIARTPYGDCDDHQLLTTGLLLHGGVEPRNIFMLSGMVSYQSPLSELKSGHAFVIVKDNDDYLLLDNNLVGTPKLDPKNPVINGTPADELGNALKAFGKTAEVKTELEFIFKAVDGRGTPFENSEALKSVVVYMTGFTEKLNNSNASAAMTAGGQGQSGAPTPTNIAPDFNNAVQNAQIAAPQPAPPQRTAPAPSVI